LALRAFTLSLRDVARLLAERGIIVTYESIRVWVARFGPLIARRLRQHSASPAERLLQFNDDLDAPHPL
jgi:putative transposase